MTSPEDAETLTDGRVSNGAAAPPGTDVLRAKARPLLRKLAVGQGSRASEPPASARPEVRRAGDYQLGDALGMGGFGVVYRAEHVERGTPAAVKIPHPELANNASALARLDREIEAIRRLCHPNVVEIFDVGRLEDGRPYFAMELLTGVSLFKHMRAHGRLSPDEALDILEPLCSALSAAHEHAVIHRDIKPSNVFLCDTPEGTRVVLLDFGIAKLLDATGPALTASRDVVGTLTYIAPEQLLGASVDPQTDVYGLGVLLYTMLTGAPPFGVTPSPNLRQLLLEGPVPRPSSRARVGPALENVILRAMSRSKAERHPSVAALLAAARQAVTRAPESEEEFTGAPLRHALGVYIEVLADPSDLGAGDENLFADFESILPCARAHLLEAGLSTAFEAGTSMLLVTPRADDPDLDEETRRRALSAVLALYQLLETRTGGDPRVRAHLCVHEGELLTDRSGALVGGDLLGTSAWVPERPLPGLFVATPTLARLGVITEPTLLDGGALLYNITADTEVALESFL